MTTKVFVFGASGHAKVIIDILERLPDFSIAFLVDDDTSLHGQRLAGYSVIGGRPALLAERTQVGAGIVAIGDNNARRTVAAWLNTEGLALARAIHPNATLARTVTVGDGTAIMAGCVVNSDTTLGNNVILNTGATVDHDCVIEEGVHIGPGCHLCGGVHVGAGSFLGAGSIVVPGVHIGCNVVAGAGSTIIHDVADGNRIAGSPARPLANAS